MWRASLNTSVGVDYSMSFVLWAATLAMVRYILRGWLPFALAVLLMVSSNGFYDYTTSGLENPLGYLAISVYAMFYTRRLDGKNDALPLLFTLGAAVLIRHDIATLLLVPTVYALWQDRNRRGARQWALYILAALTPLALWTAFSLIYYGFPFPNTVYAKTYIDLPRYAVIAQQGVLDYWWTSFRVDSVTVLALFAAFAAAVTAPNTARGPALALVAGIALNCAYITSVGGDFMIGRFLSFAFLIALFGIHLCVRNDGIRQTNPRQWYARLAVALLVLAAFHLAGTTPLNTPLDLGAPGDPNPAISSRSWYQPMTSLQQYAHARQNGTLFPVMPPHPQWDRIKTDQSDVPAYHVDPLGFFSYDAGVDEVVFDRWALSSPLLARMNASPRSNVGHYDRNIPDGMMAAHECGPEVISDPAVRSYYRRMSIVTRSPNLFAPERLREILLLNTLHRRLTPTYPADWTNFEPLPHGQPARQCSAFERHGD